MTSSYRALCNDFYINQRLNLKMDLPMRRDTVLAMFDRVRREHPWMSRFRRYQNELALESIPKDGGQQWLGLRKTSIRSGSVNPDSASDAYQLHKLVAENAPYFLDVSPLDIEYVELLFGFDLLAAGNHDAIVFDAVIAGSPLAHLADVPGASPIECQPIIGVSLGDEPEVQAHFEVKTRSGSRQSRSGEFREEPISVYLTMRKHGPVADVKELPRLIDTLVQHGESLVESRLVPSLLVPIRKAITLSDR